MDMKELKRLLGKRIKELRDELVLSQDQLAERVNVDRRNIGNIERGIVFPSLFLSELPNALKVSLPELFDFEHIDLTDENMKKYIVENLEYLPSHDITTIFRLIKSMR